MGGRPIAISPWRTSAWPPSRCFSCKARRFWPISGGCSKVKAARTVRPCSRWPLFHPAFEEIQRALQASGGLSAFVRLGNHVLIALDGTEYHRSAKIHCPRCSKAAKGGKTEYFHSMVQAAIVAPGHDRAVPLQPEFIAPQDGSEKQDC